MNNLGFKKTLVCVVVILVLLSLLITNVVSNRVLKQTTIEGLERTILNAATYETAFISKHVQRSAETAKGLADLYQSYSQRVAPEDLMKVSAVVGSVYKVTAGFDDGRSYASKHDVNFPKGVGDINKYDPRTRPWFKQGRQSNGLELSDIFFTSVGNHPMLGAIHPIENGTLLVDIRLHHLEDVLKNMHVIEGAKGIVADENGVILASTAKFADVSNSLKSLPAIAPITSQIFANEHTFNQIKIEGKDHMFLSKKIKLVTDKTWYLMILVDNDTAFAHVNSAAWELNYLALIIAAISIVLLLFVLNHLYRPVLKLKRTVQKLSDGEGDLTSRLEVKSDDDLGDIAHGINAFIVSLQSMMIDVQSMTTQLSSGVDVLRAQEKETTSILKEHSSETDMVVTAMEELSYSAIRVSEHADHAVKYTKEADIVADKSKGTIISAQESLQSLADEVGTATKDVTTMNQETQDIASILSIIGSIAEQTNLLALNAAIEAARAGEQGRGFAVVADEVRALAGKTQQSTSEIESALTSLKNGAGSVVSSIERTGNTSQNAVAEAQAVATSLGDLTDYVTQINDLSVQISTSAGEQNTVIQDLSKTMSRIHNMVEGLNTQGQSMRNETNNIANINQQLLNIVGKFKLH